MKHVMKTRPEFIEKFVAREYEAKAARLIF